ncbi:unnamed protein product [Sphagnum tenellum]
MGCSTSKSAMLASMQPGNSSSSNNNSESFVTRVLKKKFGKSRSFAPLRSNNRSRRRCDEYNYSSSYCSRMHSDYHVVALTSSTYGIMKLVEAENIMSDERKMIIDSAAATGGAETINTWELMAGLEDFTPRPPGSPLDRPGLPLADLRQKIHLQESINAPRVLKKQKQSKYSRTRSRSLSSMGAQNSEDDDHAAAAAASATVVESPSLSSWTSFSKFSTEELGKSQDQVSAGVEAAAAAFDHKLCPPGHGHERLVLYTTSLRGIRKTYDDCNKLRMIFQSYLVWIDERDVSMHAEFRQELTELMGAPVQVPRVFIMGRYIGGVEQMLQLHELGLLAPLLLPLPPPPQPHLLQPASACDGCGGLRFIPCPHCNGSCKIISKHSVSRCPHCNENGLKRCPICF